MLYPQWPLGRAQLQVFLVHLGAADAPNDGVVCVRASWQALQHVLPPPEREH